MEYGYIYKLTLLKDLESFKSGEIYIGKHNGRKKLYFSGGKVIKRIIEKYSENVFKREMICSDIDSNELLCFMERYYIKLYKCNRSKYNFGLNLTDGGEGIFGFKRSKEQCEKLSQRMKEEYKKGLRITPTGKDVYQYDIITGKYLKTYKNCTEAALAIGQPAKSNSSIAGAARDKFASAYNYIWSYRKMDIIDKTPKHYKAILQYSLNGDFIKEYNSATHAAKENNFKTSPINNCLKNKSKKSYGYVWKYKETKSI